MTKRRRVTAEELVAQLQSDPAYQAEIEAQAIRADEVRAAADELLRGIAMIGYPSGSFQELLQIYAPLPGPLATFLAQNLLRINEPVLQETVVRALGAAGEALDVAPLVALFERTDLEPLRWAIANTLAELRPSGLRHWLLQELQTPHNGKAREMLAVAVARTAPSPEANAALLKLWDELPGHVALALAESGTAAELSFLQAHVGSVKGWVKKEVERAIRAIIRRA